MSHYYISILQGALLTVAVSLASLLVSTVLGLLGATAKLSGRRPLVWLATLYTTVVRGIPELVLMLLVFYGAAIGINNLFEAMGSDYVLDLNPFIAGVATLGFIYGAYMTETFRAAILSIPKGQMEAAWAFGMGPVRTFLRITLPQMVRYALPGYTNNWLVLIKATALISLVGLQDMMARAKSAGDATHEPFTYILAAAAIYLAITSVSLLVLRYLERRYSAGVKAMEI